MERIQIQDYSFEIDLKKTAEYYRTHGLCDCANCLSFYAHIKGSFPKMEAFLSEFGIDISRPDHVWSQEAGGVLHCISVDYTVCGKVTTTGTSELCIDSSQAIKPVITNGFVSPNDQTSEYFTISFDDIYLPLGHE